jgi:predicted nucleic acid-binding protein
MKKSAVASPRRTVIVDAGPLKAAIDRSDADHVWAVRAFRTVSGRFVTFEAAIAEAQHGLENHLAALKALRQLVARMDIVPVAVESVFNEVERWAPRMDLST